MENTDRRYQRTHKLIKSELEAMLIESEYSDVTVKELCTRINLNRKTFYNHFANLDAVLEELLKEFTDKAMIFLEKTAYAEGRLHISGVLTGFFSMIPKEMPYYRRILYSKEGPSKVWGKNVRMLAEKNSRLLSDILNMNDFKTKTALYYLAYGIMPTYIQWLQSGQSMSSDELGELLESLILRGAASALEIS